MREALRFPRKKSADLCLGGWDTATGTANGKRRRKHALEVGLYKMSWPFDPRSPQGYVYTGERSERAHMDNRRFFGDDSLDRFFEGPEWKPVLDGALYRIAFRRLYAIAAALLRKERRGHTLQPTALISELFLKLRRLETRVLNAEHFFRIAAEAMHQVLIDSARAKHAAKRIPADWVPDMLAGAGGRHYDPELRLTLKIGMERLRVIDRLAAETMWLRCADGLTVEEVGSRQGRECWRVRADYDFALTWLRSQLGRHRSPAMPPVRRSNPRSP